MRRMDSDPVRHALSYPFEIPTRSYVVAGDGYEELAESATPPDVSGRRPVLALGSNQSPRQLIRKYKDCGLGPITAVRARLHDFDVVYSAHVASYGSIPATLLPCPGARVAVFVLWLDPAQEARMHETEVASGNYHFGRLDGVTLAMEIGGDRASAFVYVGRRGALVRDGAPVALAEVAAENRTWPALGQQEIQAHVRDCLAPGRPLDAFIRAAVDDPAERLARAEALMADGHAFAYPSFAPEAL